MKTLISITSCNRLSEIKKYIWEYLRFVNTNDEFHFVLALDGSNKEYADFAEEYDIPLIFSEEREGVGLSKNRILSHFPDYEYYIFIEDDIELIDPGLFGKVIAAHSESNIHHFCNHHIKRVFDRIVINNEQIEICWTGGAQFAFYSKTGIDKVGGFNPLFSKYKRFGHTEHTYRFYHQNLQRGPFVFSENWLKSFLIHSPPKVTKVKDVIYNENRIIQEEQLLIDNKTEYCELKTLSQFYFNNKKLGYNNKVADFLAANLQKYPLTTGKERRVALAEHYALRILKTEGLFRKIVLILKSFSYYPTNVALKHHIKSTLFGKR